MEAFKEWKRYRCGEEEPLTGYTDHQNLPSFLTKMAGTSGKFHGAKS